VNGVDDDSDAAHAPTEVATPSDAPTAVSQSGTAPRARADSKVLIDLDVRLGDRYVIKDLVGEGGMGAVYRAFDETLGADVALKVVRRAFATTDQLRDEVRLAQRVTHRNVCRTYDLEDVGGRYFLKMEYIAGETLAARLARGGSISIDEVVRIARAIADGLAAAHAEGIVHRDLKPGNVMLAGDRVVLMDFGLALRASGDETDRSGTPGYMSPEQLAGRAVDSRSDLYALGCVAYELVTGERVTGSTDVRTKRADAPRWLGRAIEDLLALDPARRPRGARVLARGPRSWKLAAAGVAALAVAAASVWWMWPAPVWRADIQTIFPIFDENSVGPVLSPDGKTLAFCAQRAGAAHWDVYLQPVEGGEPTKILEQCSHPSWLSADRLVVRRENVDPPHIYEATVTGQIVRDRGSGFLAKRCGDDLIVQVLAGRSDLVVRRSERGDEVLAHTPLDIWLHDLACTDSGDRVAYAADAPVGLTLLDHAGSRSLSETTDELVFTPRGRSLVFVAKEEQSSDLFELVLGDARPHRLTSGAHARAPDVSRDGSVLVFDEDITTVALFEVGASKHVQLTWRIEHLRDPYVAPDGRQLVAENSDNQAVVVVDLETGSEREVGKGRSPTFSADGRRVLYVDPDDPRRVLVRAIDEAGSAPEEFVRVSDPIWRMHSAADGLHVAVDRGDENQAIVIGADRQPRVEGNAGLIIPSASGWRAMYTSSKLRVVAPGQDVSEGYVVETSHGLPAWVGDHELSYCDRHVCHVLDVVARKDLETVPIEHDPEEPIAASPAAHRWFGTDYVAHIVRKRIVNFASRPWAP
jgi:hypothetical protein